MGLCQKVKLIFPYQYVYITCNFSIKSIFNALSLFSGSHKTTYLLDPDIMAADIEKDSSGKYVETKLGGGFSIKDILKTEYCFAELAKGKEKNKNNIDAKYSTMPNISIPNQIVHIDTRSSDSENAILNKNSSIVIPNNATTAYCEYVLQLQEKIHQQLLLKNSQTTKHKGILCCKLI